MKNEHGLQVTFVNCRRALRRFIALPYRLMKEDPWWCPPLRSEVRKRLDSGKNPFFSHSRVELLLAYRGGLPVGRAAAIVDRNYDEVHGGKDLLFGWFDCEDSPVTASAIFEELEKIARRQGRSRIIGPLTFSINEEAGMLVDGFASPHRLMTPHNPSWYPGLLVGQGFRKLQDLFAYRWVPANGMPEKLERAALRCLEKTGVTLSQLNLKNYQEETAELFDIYNDAFETTWGHVPLTREEFLAMSADLRRVGDPRITFIVRTSGKPVGFGLTLPDWNQAISKARGRLWPIGLLRILLARRRIDAARFIVLAVKQRYRNQGFEAAIIYHTIESFMRLGYREGELSMVLESNIPMRRIIEHHIGAKVFRRYRIFQKVLTRCPP